MVYRQGSITILGLLDFLLLELIILIFSVITLDIFFPSK
jgi:hypothetical protein